MSDVTVILSQIQAGDRSAADSLLLLVYEELRKLAAARLVQEKPGQTLQATALVHEVYLRLMSGEQEQSWKNRGHFFAAAAEAMRRILIDQARHKGSQKRGGGRSPVPLEGVVLVSNEGRADPSDILALSDALDALAADDPVKAQLVKLRYFVGLSLEEAAEAVGISPATAKRHWVYARAWLYGKLSGE